MNCERIREAASARLDGEPIGMSAAALDNHLARCPMCAGWLAGVTALARQTRITGMRVPDLSDRILADVARPAARLRRRSRLLRLALAIVGLAQLAMAAPAVFGDDMGMAMSMHASHESAAWNAALGIAFLATTLRPRRASGLLPMLAAFVVVLAALSIRDLIAGGVTIDRLATHIGCLLGLLLVGLISRTADARPDYPSAVAAADDSSDTGEQPPLRGVA